MTSHECTGYTEENQLTFNDAQNFADWMKTGGNAKFHIIILFFRFFSLLSNQIKHQLSWWNYEPRWPNYFNQHKKWNRRQTTNCSKNKIVQWVCLLFHLLLCTELKIYNVGQFPFDWSWNKMEKIEEKMEIHEEINEQNKKKTKETKNSKNKNISSTNWSMQSF